MKIATRIIYNSNKRRFILSVLYYKYTEIKTTGRRKGRANNAKLERPGTWILEAIIEKKSLYKKRGFANQWRVQNKKCWVWRNSE